MRASSIVTAIILIAVGTIFLLSNLGYLPGDAWDWIWRLWPLALVALGLALLLGRSNREVQYRSDWTPGTSAAGTEPRDEHLSIPLPEAHQAQVEVHFGAGELRLGDEAEPGALLSGDFRYGARQDLRVDKGWAWLTLRQPDFDPSLFNWQHPDIRWDVHLARDLPMALIFKMGASRAWIDLSELSVPEVTVETGASQTDLTLPAHGQTYAHVKSGAAQVNIHVPATVSARIHGTMALGSLGVDRSRFPAFGDSYRSSDFDTATDRVDITVEGGVGQVKVD